MLVWNIMKSLWTKLIKFRCSESTTAERLILIRLTIDIYAVRNTAPDWINFKSFFMFSLSCNAMICIVSHLGYRDMYRISEEQYCLSTTIKYIRDVYTNTILSIYVPEYIHECIGLYRHQLNFSKKRSLKNLLLKHLSCKKTKHKPSRWNKW